MSIAAEPTRETDARSPRLHHDDPPMLANADAADREDGSGSRTDDVNSAASSSAASRAVDADGADDATVATVATVAASPGASAAVAPSHVTVTTAITHPMLTFYS